VADALIGAVERGRSGENYLLGGADASFLELVAEVCRLTGRRAPRRTTPAPLLRLAGWLGALQGMITGREPMVTPEGVEMALLHARIVSTKAERELGYRPSPLSVMVEDCVRWLKTEGLIP
jgi:nucleoside-diphosphate-sugar epimerase